MIDSLLRIRIFLAVYEEGSFTAAAAREHATQSGVTQHVQKLEEFLGVQLFVRRSGATRPTSAADAYYRACVEVLRVHSQSREAVRPFARGLAGVVQVGLTPTLTRCVLAPTLSAFLADHPNVIVRVTDAYSDVVIAKVLSGDLDFAVVPGGPTEVALRRRHFAATPELLVSGVRAGNDLIDGAPVRLADLGPLKLVVPSRAQARRATLDAYLAESGAIVERLLEIDTGLGALDFVRNSDWHAIHPAVVMLPEIGKGGFIVNPLIEPPLKLDLFQIERASEQVSPEATAFLQELERHTKDAITAVERLTRAPAT